MADVHLERKLRYDFAKFRAKGRSRASCHSRYASATSVATSPGQTLTMEPSDHTTIGGKRSISKADLDRDVRKRQRHTGNLAEAVSQTPMSFPTQDTHATLPDIGFDHDVADVEVSVQRGTGGSYARRATPEVVGVSAEEHAEVIQELKSLREAVV